MDERERRLAHYEHSFRRAGLPLMIEDFSPRSDVFNRASPLLALVLVVELIGALDVDWPLLANLATVLGALVAALAAFALVNRLRGRPALALPEEVGTAELTVFVILPFLVHLVFHGGWGYGVAAFNLALLVAAVLLYGLGLGAIVVWAARRLGGQLARSLPLLARAVPLLLLFSLVLFLTTEMWQVFADRTDATLIAIAVLLALVAIAFLAARLPREIATLEHEINAGAPLRPLQRANVGVVLLVSHGLQIAVVTLAVGAFFVAFGTIAIDAEALRAWIGTQGDAIVSTTVLDVPLHLTAELLRVAGAIAALSGLYYAIAVLTDSAYRDEFLDEITAEMRATFAARLEYLALRAAR